MANRIIAAQYTSDAGNEYVVGVNEEVFDQPNAGATGSILGGSTALPSEPLDPLPRQMKPRRVVAFNPAGKRREIICLTPTAELYAVGATVTLEDSDGASTVYTVSALKAEQSRRRRQQT